MLSTRIFAFGILHYFTDGMHGWFSEVSLHISSSRVVLTTATHFRWHVQPWRHCNNQRGPVITSLAN